MNKGPMFVTTLAQIANRSYDYNGRDNVYYPPMQYKRFRYFRQYEYSPRTIRGLLEYKPIIARPLLLPPLGFKWFFFAPHFSLRFLALFFPPLFHRSPPRSFRFLSSPSKMPDRSRTGPEFEGVSHISVRFLRKSKTLSILFSRCQICFFPNGEDEIIII